MADQHEGLSEQPLYGDHTIAVARTTRRPADAWDRLKILVLLGIVIGAILGTRINPPFDPASEVIREFLGEPIGILLVTLFGLELLRQIHYLVSERWSAYHRFWQQGVFGSLERLSGRVKPWTRFRLARLVRWGIYLLIYAFAAVYFGAAGSVGEAIVNAPRIIAGVVFNPVVIQGVVLIFFVVFQFAAIFWFLSRGGTDIVMPEEIKTRFTDVWGQDAVLDLIRENIAFLEKPDEIEAKGGYIPGGILLWGPPGTGKTLLAEAIAGETGRPFVFVEPGAFMNMFFGVGILKVKGLYRKLRKLSLRHGGVIVFFDEADALGSRGQLAAPPGGFGQITGLDSMACNGMHFASPQTLSLLAQLNGTAESSEEDTGRTRRIPRIMMGMGMGGGGMGTLQALLTEMNGLTKPRGISNRIRKLLGFKPKPPPKYRILHIMATNMPNALDEAMLRPGRIDRIYKVGYPSKEGRRVTFDGYLAKVKNDLTEEEVEELAVMTPYYTGAKIKDLVNEALILAIRDGRETITWQDLWRAKSLKELGPPDDSEYIERERHAVAVHEASHAVVAHLMMRHKKIDLATIERRGSIGGMVKPITMEDRFTMWKSEYEAEIMTFIASLAGERMFFEADNSSGVSNDLRVATQIVASMEGVYGMGDGITSWLGLPQQTAWQTPDPTEKVIGHMHDRVERRLKDLYQQTWDLLDSHRDRVLAVAAALEERKTISGDEVAAIMGSEPGSRVSHQPSGWNLIDEEAVRARLASVASARQAPSTNGHETDENGEVPAGEPSAEGSTGE